MTSARDRAGRADSRASSSAATEMGALLTGAVSAVVEAQVALDEDSLRRTTDWLDSEAGTVVPPPMWWSLSSVALELQTSVTVRRTQTGQSRLACRTLDPRSVSLYGYEASSGLRMRLLVERQGPVRPRPPDEGATEGDAG